MNRAAGFEVRIGTAADMPAIIRMLEQNGLPVADLDESKPEFTVLADSTGIVAAGALQYFGNVALLRSVVVANDRRQAGHGARMVALLEARAIERGITDLVLLTQTAEQFFSRRGYRTVPRELVPAPVKTSAEFRSLCPDSAHCMSKRL